MKTGTKLALAFGLSAAAAVFAVAPGSAEKAQKAPFLRRNIAHRGLHTKDKTVPENSLASFRMAARNGYGVELDVQLSRDGRVVVFHDDTLSRVCGVDCRVDQLKWDELQQLRLFDTDERIPLFADVLAELGGSVPLIVELKTGRRNRELCEKTNELLRAYGGDACIESFDPFIVFWFRRHAPERLRGQLAAQTEVYRGGGMDAVRSFILSNTLLNFLARPQFIAYKLGKRPLPVRAAEKMGAMRVGWTARRLGAERNHDAVIFEHYLPSRRY
ncbi:MAG: glycerophosphodiester phosphodiesterase [Oscillospiraceae bacterium]|nr:glycerophosphodiester phosphodiesterase [Oscillospiraceae bacterium]